MKVEIFILSEKLNFLEIYNKCGLWVQLKFKVVISYWLGQTRWDNPHLYFENVLFYYNTCFFTLVYYTFAYLIFTNPFKIYNDIKQESYLVYTYFFFNNIM